MIRLMEIRCPPLQPFSALTSPPWRVVWSPPFPLFFLFFPFCYNPPEADFLLVRRAGFSATAAGGFQSRRLDNENPFESCRPSPTTGSLSAKKKIAPPFRGSFF